MPMLLRPTVSRTLLRDAFYDAVSLSNITQRRVVGLLVNLKEVTEEARMMLLRHHLLTCPEGRKM
jgi:hypothetical protein